LLFSLNSGKGLIIIHVNIKVWMKKTIGQAQKILNKVFLIKPIFSVSCLNH